MAVIWNACGAAAPVAEIGLSLSSHKNVYCCEKKILDPVVTTSVNLPPLSTNIRQSSYVSGIKYI